MTFSYEMSARCSSSRIASVFLLIALSAASSTAALGQSRFTPSNDFIADWMSQQGTVCINMNEEKTACEAVWRISTVTQSTVDGMLYMIPERGFKIAVGMRQNFTDQGLCWTVPDGNDLFIQFYQTADASAEISDQDVLLALSDEMRSEFARGLAGGGFGARIGDELCGRYRYHEREGSSIYSLRETAYLNGEMVVNQPDSIIRFLPTDLAVNLIIP